MKKHPLKILGVIFTCIAAVELIAVLVLLITLSKEPEALMISGGVLGIQTLVFGTIGLCFWGHARKKERLREELLACGHPELAEVTEVERVLSVRINSRHPYRVVCRIRRDGVLHEYRSDMLMHNPGLMPGDPITVYTDQQNDRRYYVDVESASPPVVRH